MPDHSETRHLDETGRTVNAKGDDYGMNLVEAVRMWPTPTGTGNNNRKGLSERSGDGLATAVHLWPTPTSRDHKDTGDCANVPVNCLLGRAVGPTKTNGSLAPEFVEYLMGFPIGYTDCEPSGTPSSRRKSTRSSRPSPTSSEG